MGIDTDINGHSENRKKTSLKKHTPYYIIHRNIYTTNMLRVGGSILIYFCCINEEINRVGRGTWIHLQFSLKTTQCVQVDMWNTFVFCVFYFWFPAFFFWGKGLESTNKCSNSISDDFPELFFFSMVRLDYGKTWWDITWLGVLKKKVNYWPDRLWVQQKFESLS